MSGVKTGILERGVLFELRALARAWSGSSRTGGWTTWPCGSL